MNVSNFCKDCIYRYNCPINGHVGNAACLTVRKTTDELRKELKGMTINTVTKDTKFDTTSDTVTDEAVFASLWALKKYCASHKCDENCVLYEGDCRILGYDSPAEFYLRENMIKKVVIWED